MVVGNKEAQQTEKTIKEIENIAKTLLLTTNGQQVNIANVDQTNKEIQRWFKIVANDIIKDFNLDGGNIGITLDRNSIGSATLEQNGIEYSIGFLAWNKANDVYSAIALLVDQAFRLLALNPSNYETFKLKADMFTDKLGNSIHALISRRDRYRNSRWNNIVSLYSKVTTTKLDRDSSGDEFGFFGYSIELSDTGTKWVDTVIKPNTALLFNYSESTRIEKESKPKAIASITCNTCNETFTSATSQKHNLELHTEGYATEFTATIVITQE